MHIAPRPDLYVASKPLLISGHSRLMMQVYSSAERCVVEDLSDVLCVYRWIDIFHDFPGLSGNVPLAAFLELCPVMHPRHYSIASSSWSKSNQVHCIALMPRLGSKVVVFA